MHGWDVFVPTGHTRHADFMADDGQRPIRVQVKTSSYHGPNTTWQVAICTRGGNQSWSGVVKRFSAAHCDELFVVVADGRRWRIPAGAVEGTRGINVGGRKYGEFEVDAGPPLTVVEHRVSLPSSAPAG